jgi:hypothetical protein
LSEVLPAIFLCSAQQSGKAGRTSHVKVSAKLEHEVQQVLQNYLHYTRSLPFADAEHISLYAPCFLQKLVSRLNAQKHISKALEGYLLYNPINEFEPFFESIGVKTSEIHRFLPPGKIYLNEDKFLLANVSTLRNSGFPSHVLGRLYKEHPELFSSSTAKLQMKLQFYEKLGVSKVSLIRIMTCCPSLLNDDVHIKFVTVANGLNGFQVEKNRICCLLEKNPLKCSSILEKLMLLAGIGCPWDEISMLYRTKPQLFIYSSEKALYSVVDFLSNLGLRKENIGNIILHYPEILRWDPIKSVAVNPDLASVGLDQREMIGTDLCLPLYLHADTLIKLIEDVNCTGLEKQGVAVLIREHLKSTMPMTPLSKVSSAKFQNIPSAQSELAHRRDDLIVRGSKRRHLKSTMPGIRLSKVSSENFQNILSGGSELIHRRDDLNVHGAMLKHASGTEEINISENLREPIRRHKLNLLLKLGLLNYPESMFKVARRIHCESNKLQERLSCLLRLGFPFNVVCHMVRTEPTIMNRSAHLIQKKFDFLCSTTFNPLQALTTFPQYFSYHLEGRIKPRYQMYAWLKKNDFLKKEYVASSIFRLPERRFVQKFVNCHPEGSKYFSFCKLGQVMPRTPLSKVSSEKIQNSLYGGSELVHRRDDLNVAGAKLKNASGSQEINISDNLHDPISRHKLNF